MKKKYRLIKEVAAMLRTTSVHVRWICNRYQIDVKRTRKQTRVFTAHDMYVIKSFMKFDKARKVDLVKKIIELKQKNHEKSKV